MSITEGEPVSITEGEPVNSQAVDILTSKFLNMENEKTIKNDGNPLWMPVGSVRALLALSVCALFIVSVFFDKNIVNVKEVFLVMVGFYFGQKAD